VKFTYPLAVFSDPREPDIPIPLRHPQESTLMSNPAYGDSNVPERWAVRISDNGEFIHQTSTPSPTRAWSCALSAES